MLIGIRNDRDQCHVIVDQIVDFARDNGSRQSYKRALECYLPSSPIYDFLEGRVPNPALTFTRLAEITETDEKERINKEIGERRTRLGAKIGQVTLEVYREVFACSDLEQLYQSIIEWTSDDELRWSYEEKLLKRAYDHLVALPAEEKAEKRPQVVKLVHDMVIVKHPYQLAWQLELEWQDLENLSELDENVLKEYILFFPVSSMANVVRGFLGLTEVKEAANGHVNSVAEEEDSADDEKHKEMEMDKRKKESFKALNAEDRVLVLLDGANDTKESSFANRVVSDYYLKIEEYEGCVEVSRAARDFLYVEAQKSGLELQHSFDAINANLATSLVFYQAPKNHPEAKNLFDDILKRKPESTAALLGTGLIFEEQENFVKAVSFLSKAHQRDPNNMRIATEAAWCRILTGDAEQGLEELQDYLQTLLEDKKSPADLKAQTLYRVGKSMWDLKTDRASRKDRNGAYARFISALKANPSFAPPYTSLGLYYADYAKDRKRARQCFHKAFELSSSEVLAAERLARDFAEDAEWDVVELISDRVIDSGVVRPAPGSKRKGVSWPFAALGVVQMNKQEYPKACISFQAALRISPQDYDAWVGLGESYHSSGRYIAAQRTLEHALGLRSEAEGTQASETWFARYMLANVMRELGDYEKALAGYREVLVLRSNEFGVAIALLQTLVEQCTHHLETGFFGRAAEGARIALEEAANMTIEYRHAFNYWKAVGDACLIFTSIPGYSERFPSENLSSIFESEGDIDLDLLKDIDSVTFETIKVGTGKPSIVCSLSFAIIAYKHALHSTVQEIHAQAVAWYNLGLAEWRMHNSQGQNLSDFAKAAVRCFKRAIELEASNADFWNALGVVTTNLNARVAQHAFVRSLFLNERSARTWTNLGTLYLLQDDYELAHTAFGRAQSTDPEYANAWVGEGLIAMLTGDAREALAHFTHAVEITDASSRIAKGLYVTSAFDSLLSTRHRKPELADLTQAVLALQQLQVQTTDTDAFRHLLGLLQERTGDHAAAVESLRIICEKKEAQFEETEDAAVLASFCKAKADLARNQLAVGEYQASAESAQTVLDLSEYQDGTAISQDELRKVRLSAHLTGGLAHFKLGSYDEALEVFRSALEESDSSPDVVCLLSQVLWAKGTEEDRSAAKDQLFECIEKHAGHVGATTLLGAMSALDADEATQEAVLADIQGLRTSDTMNTMQKRQLDLLQAKLAELQVNSEATAEDSQAQLAAGVFLTPYESTSWSALGRMSGEAYPAQMALKTASASVPPFGSASATRLSQVYAETGTAGDAQRAIALCPWRKAGWESLSDCIA